VTVATLNYRDFPPVEENIERPETLSQTLLSKHDRCPRSAYLARRYKTGSVEMDRGTAFHMVPERATALMLEQSPPETTIPGEICRELADAVMAERTDLVLPAEEQDAVRAMAWNWGEAWTVDPETFIGTEVPLELEIGGFVVTCRIDLVEGQGSTIHIHDYKTGLNIRKREEIQRGFQGKLYGLAVLFGQQRETGLNLGAGINDVWFYETYPRYRDKEGGGLIKKEGVWTRTELAEFKVSLERNIERFAESLETGDWPARDGSWCSECPAPTECPIPAHLRSVEQITNASEAEDAFSRKMALERESRRLQAGLRGFVKEHGQPIFVGDYAFDAAVAQSKEVIDWDELIVGLTRTSELGAPFEINDHIRIKQSTKFGKRKKTEEEIDGD
jgi:RecB family exonuclease